MNQARANFAAVIAQHVPVDDDADTFQLIYALGGLFVNVSKSKQVS